MAARDDRFGALAMSSGALSAPSRPWINNQLEAWLG